GSSKELLAEHDDAWLNIEAGIVHWLDDGTGFVWMTEHSGQWTLELHGPDGALVRTLTKPDFGLRELSGVVGGAAIVEASAEPTPQDIWRVPLDGAAPVRLSDGDGVATLVKAKHGVVFDTVLHGGGRRTTAVVGDTKRELPTVAERPSLVPTTVLETVAI